MEEVTNSNSDSPFLSYEINKELRAAINSSALFYKDKKENLNWNFFCALMDRLDSCLNYLNHLNPVDSEENFIMFITFSNMIVDGIYQMFKTLNITDPSHNDASCFSQRGIYGDATDDEFFRYFRSLSIAHPLESNRHPKYLIKKEIQYSPFVIAGRSAYTPNVGIRIYSSAEPENLRDMTFPFSELSSYIQKKHKLLSYATKWIKDRLEHYKVEWSKRTVNRSLSPIEILKENYIKWLIISWKKFLLNYLKIILIMNSDYSSLSFLKETLLINM